MFSCCPANPRRRPKPASGRTPAEDWGDSTEAAECEISSLSFYPTSNLPEILSPFSSFLRLFLLWCHTDWQWNDTDSCTDDSYSCSCNTVTMTITTRRQTGDNRKDLWRSWGVGNVLRGLECHLLPNYSFHSPRRYFSGRPILGHAMITPLLVQQCVTWCNLDDTVWKTPRLMWRSCVTCRDKPRVCHEATLPKISTGNFLSNMSATVGSDTCNVLWWGECAQSERIPDWCDSAWHRDKPTEGECRSHQATLSTFSICKLSKWHYLDLCDLSLDPVLKQRILHNFLKVQTRIESLIDIWQTKISCPIFYWLSDQSPKQILSYTIHLPTIIQFVNVPTTTTHISQLHLCNPFLL